MISVIIPVYNKKDYLDSAIRSILEQEYQKFEIILVDDGSTDGCSLLCDQYQREFNKIKVIHQKNFGVSAARNAGLSLAKGEYILFLDADDLLGNDCLKSCLVFCEEKNVDFIQFGMIRSDTKVRDIRVRQDWRVFSKREVLNLFYKRKKITPLVCGCLYKKELLSFLRFDEKIHLGEDTLFKFEVLKKCKTVGFTENKWYLNSIIENTLSRKKINTSDIDSVITAMEKIRQYKAEDPKEQKKRNNYLFLQYYAYFNRIILLGMESEEQAAFAKLIEKIEMLDLDFRNVQVLIKKGLFLLYKKNSFYYCMLIRYFTQLRGNK